jgi:hypothetical protein
MSMDYGTTAEHLRNGPPAVGACAVRRLVAYLVACAHANGNHDIRDVFTFADADGNPDLVGARRFAEGVRDLYLHEGLGNRVGVRQTYNRVVLRLIPMDEVAAEDAIVATPALSC